MSADEFAESEGSLSDERSEFDWWTCAELTDNTASGKLAELLFWVSVGSPEGLESDPFCERVELVDAEVDADIVEMLVLLLRPLALTLLPLELLIELLLLLLLLLPATFGSCTNEALLLRLAPPFHQFLMALSERPFK